MSSNGLGDNGGNDQTPMEPSPDLGRSDSHLQVDVYRAQTHDISLKDLPQLQELTVGVFWPHRDRDLQMLIAQGQGLIALDEIGRPLSSAMKFEMGSDFAMLGMMITAPRLQSLGTGRWLLEQIMESCGARDMRLSATRAGYRLYENAGFIPVSTIRQHQGLARDIFLPEPLGDALVRPATKNDWEQVLTLDARAFGADRASVLAALNVKSEVMVFEEEGHITGFAMVRNFGRGQVIGPVVAGSDEMAMQLIAPIIKERAGKFLRLDTPLPDGDLTAFLSAAGLGLFDTVTEMYKGEQRRRTSGTALYGLAAHSLG